MIEGNANMTKAKLLAAKQRTRAHIRKMMRLRRKSR
jgi:hypothetical protein